MSVLTFSAVLLAALAVSGGPAQTPEFGPAEVQICGRPAPPASGSVCGFSVVADKLGPQIAFTRRPTSCLTALRAGEEVEIAAAIRGVSGPCTIAVEASADASCEADVSVAICPVMDGYPMEPAWQTVRLAGQGDAELVRCDTEASGGEALFLFRVKADSPEAAVRLSGVRLSCGSQSWEVPLAPPAEPEGDGPPRVLPPLRPAIEEALVEWDWRMQDGIETECAAVGCPEAIGQALQRGDALVADLQGDGVSLGEKLTRWRDLHRRWEALSTAGAAETRQWEDLWRQVHRLRREIALSNPALPAGPLAFVKQVPGIFSHQLTQCYGSCARPGGGVFVLEAPGRSMKCRTLTEGLLPEGSYQHLDASYDGRRMLFSFCHAETTPKNREQCLDRFFHLYEIDADGGGLRQLTDGPYDDFAPRYLPGGKILFVSTRRGGFHRCGRGPCPVYTLTLAEADGSHARTISYHETHEWDPAVLADGGIVYTRWDYVDRNAVHYQQLWRVRPDGSNVQIFFGNNTWNPVGIWEPRAVPGSTRVMATAAAHHAMTAGSIILVDPSRGVDGPQPITRLTPDALFPESEVPVARAKKGQWIAAVVDRAGLDVPPEAERWPGHCYRSPFPLSEQYLLAAYSFERLIGEPDGNPANMFGLYLVDCFGNKELLYRDLNLSSLWPAWLEERPKPPVVPSCSAESGAAQGVFLLQNVDASWPAVPKRAIRRLRIVQVLPKTTPHINDPPVGAANGSPGKQVLGTVPVEADGSACFRAPAGVPLAFQALDEHGRAVQMMRSVTYLQPGETVGCVGCHEPRTAAPAAGGVPLAAIRPPSTIAPGPDGSNPLSYPLLVQPVLDRKCVGCHNPDRPDGQVLLTGQPEGRYTVSYNALAPRVPYSAWVGNSGSFLASNGEPTTMPGRFGAIACGLMDELLAGHEGVTLSPEEIETLATWMDANALFYGTFDPADQARQQRGGRIAGPRLE